MSKQHNSLSYGESETEFKNSLIELLELHGHKVTPQNSRVPANRKTQYRPGTSDLIVTDRQRGQAWHIEVKKETGTSTASQIEMRQEFIDAGLGWHWFVVRPSNYQEELKKRGLI